MNKINLLEKFSKFDDRWSPKVVAALNGQEVKLVKSLGEFPWHHHDHEDELFLVVRGVLRMEFQDAASAGAVRSVELHPGEMIVVPRGVEHRPVAEEEVWLALFEPAATLNTGNAGGVHTVEKLAWI